MQLDQLWVVLPDKKGGVACLVKHLLEGFSRDELKQTQVILTSDVNDNSVLFDEDFPCQTLRFRYDGRLDNRYLVYRNLARLIPASATMVANDWLEMGMAATLAWPRKVVFLAHGNYEYYYMLSKLALGRNGMAVCVAPAAVEFLAANVPLAQDRVHAWFPPFKRGQLNGNNQHDCLRLIFVGRTEAAKGFFLLPEIDAILKDWGITVQWTVVAPPRTGETPHQWLCSGNVKYIAVASNQQVVGLYPEQDIFILPSSAEGLPLAAAEAVSCGLVALTTRLRAFDPLVHHQSNGYQLESMNPADWAAIIQGWDQDRKGLAEMRAQSIKVAGGFPASNQSVQQFKRLLGLSGHQSAARERVFMSVLDRWFIPNILVRGLRKFRRGKQ